MMEKAKHDIDPSTFMLRFLEEATTTELIADVERIRINYYEDGIDAFRLTLKMKSIVAISKFNGNEMTQQDIFNIMLDNMKNMKVSS